MNKNKLIAYKKSIFNNIIDFFKNIFSRKQASQNEDFTVIDDKDNSFIQNIQVFYKFIEIWYMNLLFFF